MSHRTRRTADPAANPARRALVAAVAVVVAVGLAVLPAVGTDRPASAQSVPAGYTTDRLEAAVRWLAADAERDVARLDRGERIDVGLAWDNVIALMAAGYEGATVNRLLDRMGSATRTYIGGTSGNWITGSTAKALYGLRVAGRGSTYGGVDLEAELRANLRTEGTRVGEFRSSRLADPGYGQAFTQAWAVMALDATPRGAPSEALDWMLRMQCPNGGFRIAYPTRPTDPCSFGTHVDGTAITIMALLTVPRTTAITTAVGEASAWLRSVQHADGGFRDAEGAGTAQPRNTNSTGLAANALRAAGAGAAADRAIAFVEDRQLLCTVAAEHRGAFSYSVRGELATDGGSSGERATMQAVLALGLPPYGAVSGPTGGRARPLYCPAEHPIVDDEDDDDDGTTTTTRPTGSTTTTPDGGGDGNGSGGSGGGSGRPGEGPDGNTGGVPPSPLDPRDPDAEGSRATTPDDEGDPGAAARITDDPDDEAAIGTPRRPDVTVPDDDSAPIGPLAIAGALGGLLIVVALVRSGALTRTRGAPAAAPKPADGDGVGVRTEDLGAGPYG